MTRAGRSRRHRALRRAGGIALVLIAAAAAAVAALRRDPTAAFLAARDRIAAVRVVGLDSPGTARVERLAFSGVDGSQVGEVLVRRPAARAVIPRTLVVYAGQKTREQILDLIPERPDLAVVAPLYPEIPHDRLADRFAWPARLRGAVYATVASGMAALAHLDRAAIPRGRTVALAVSLGSSFGTIHAALDERIDELVVVHGGGDFAVVLRHVYRGRGKPFRAAVLPWLAEVVIEPFDPVRWIGDVAPRPVLVLATRRDRHFPVESVEALFAAAREPRRIEWTDTDHVGASKIEIVDAIVERIEAYLDETADRTP